MPLFKRTPTPPPSTVQETVPPRSPRRRGALFSSSRATADNTATTAPDARTTPPNDRGSTTSTSRIGGFFRRRSTGSSDVDSTLHTQRRRGSVGSGTAARTGSQTGRSRRGRDRSLDAARHKVTLAEKAEKEADAALATARKAVAEARRHVQTLEEEANEHARLAHQKVLGVRSLKNDASKLGRHMEK